MTANKAMAPVGTANDAADCFFCQKASGLQETPIGGYIVDDRGWLVNHGKPEVGDAGTLILSSRRHFLDFAEMSRDEVVSLHALLGGLLPAIKEVTGAPRVYFLALMAYQPHFHAWLIPQPPDSPMKAFELLTSERLCTSEAAVATAAKIRARLAAHPGRVRPACGRP
jgi:diadenosine tetraphosphate (Ap4A) HIT family hydrolase